MRYALLVFLFVLLSLPVAAQRHWPDKVPTYTREEIETASRPLLMDSVEFAKLWQNSHFVNVGGYKVRVLGSKEAIFEWQEREVDLVKLIQHPRVLAIDWSIRRPDEEVGEYWWLRWGGIHFWDAQFRH